MLRIVLALLATASLALAANKTCPGGTLTPTPITTTTTSSADTVTATGKPALVFQAVNTAGSATVEIQICCIGTCDLATGSWAQVSGSPMTLAVNSFAVGVANPACQYRAYSTACTGCSVSVAFACSGS